MRRSGRGERTILLIDDDEYVHALVVTAARRAGAHLFQARSAAEGLALARAEAPSIAIVDVGLPDGDGFAVARELRDLPGRARLRVIILTGSAAEPKAARDAGADALLHKPFLVRDLLALIRPADA